MKGSVPEPLVIDNVLNVIKKQANLAGNIKSHITTHMESASAQIENLRGKVKNLKKMIEKANGAKLSLWEKQHSGTLLPEAYQSESKKLTRQNADHTGVIAELESKIRNLEMESGQEDIFVERLSKQSGIQELSREIVVEYVQAVRVYAPDRIEITLNYADGYGSVG